MQYSYHKVYINKIKDLFRYDNFDTDLKYFNEKLQQNLFFIYIFIVLL